MAFLLQLNPGVPPADSVGMQLVFDVTRSLILPPIRTLAGVEMPLVDPEHPWLVTMRWTDNTPALTGPGGPSLTIQYVGEPLRLLGPVWLRMDAQQQLLNAVKPEEEIANWLKCRAKGARGDKARQMFLALDKATHPALLVGLSPKGRARRRNLVSSIQELLTTRLSMRGQPQGLRPPIDFKADLQEVSSLVRRIIERRFKQRRAATRVAFDRFAAGLLRQECPVTHPDLKEKLRNGCDADGALVFLFAELALAVRHLAGEPGATNRLKADARFWGTLLNSLVRMQPIYVARHTPDPGCFKDYGSPPPPPLAEAALKKIVRAFERKKPESVLRAADQHARNVRQGFGCFG